jgi:hypothetical protein
MRKALNTTGYDTDKGLLPDYLRLYEEYFDHLVSKRIVLLELGVARGGSLLLWRDYFEKGTIVGVDINPAQIDDPTGRIHVYQGYQQDEELLDRIAREQAPEGFDVLIDDCSHIGELTRISFWHLFTNHLKPGGIYAIEDIGTSYMDKYMGSFVDGEGYKPCGYSFYDSLRYAMASYINSVLRRGTLRHFPRLANALKPHSRYARRLRSHDYGLVGFIKELIDACHVRSNWGGGPYRSAQIHRIVVSKNRAIILKSPVEEGVDKKQQGR